ncbi:unnamed protein product, partial [Schistosoma turkestanicum]
MGRLKNAKADLLKSIELEPKLSSAYWNIHLIFLLEGEPEEALHNLEQCMKCANIIQSIQSFTSTTHDCSAKDNNENLHCAIKCSTMKSYQLYQDILSSKAFIYSLLNDSQMEIETWTKLINCNPACELAYHKRANLYLK